MIFQRKGGGVSWLLGGLGKPGSQIREYPPQHGLSGGGRAGPAEGLPLQ